VKVVLDRSGIYCATSCTDKTLAIYDYHTGELMATMAGTVGKARVADPDPNWIRIQSGQWIWIQVDS
jgi:hypothetical protein